MFTPCLSANYACKVRMTGHKILRGKDEFLELDRMKLKLKVGDAMIALSNLFDGDPVLGERTTSC